VYLEASGDLRVVDTYTQFLQNTFNQVYRLEILPDQYNIALCQGSDAFPPAANGPAGEESQNHISAWSKAEPSPRGDVTAGIEVVPCWS
jgi:hypothetical protein